MAKIGEILEMFKDVEGLEIVPNEAGLIQDVILPPSCELKSKIIVVT